MVEVAKATNVLAYKTQLLSTRVKDFKARTLEMYAYAKAKHVSNA
jgi:hypothetical protein